MALANILPDYYKKRGRQAQRGQLWVEFFGEARVAEATSPPRLEAFFAHLGAQDFSSAHIQRILGVGKAGLQRAWRRGEIAGAPISQAST